MQEVFNFVRRILEPETCRVLYSMSQLHQYFTDHHSKDMSVDYTKANQYYLPNGRVMAIKSSPLRGFIGEQLARQPAGLNTRPVKSANKISYWGNGHNLALWSRLNSIDMDAASASMTPYSLLDGGIPRLKSVARKEVFFRDQVGEHDLSFDLGRMDSTRCICRRNAMNDLRTLQLFNPVMWMKLRI